MKREIKIYPIFEGRASDKVVRQLNEIFSELDLPYIAVVEGKPKTYPTVRYGWVTSYDHLPVYIYNQHGEKVKAELHLESSTSYNYSGFGIHEAFEKGIGRLELPNVVIEFDYKVSAMDYIYSYTFTNPRIKT